MQHNSLCAAWFQVHGPKGPKPLYYMIPWHVRVYGLMHTLSVKMVQVEASRNHQMIFSHQDDLHVVEDLELPSDDPEYLKDLVICCSLMESNICLVEHLKIPQNQV